MRKIILIIILLTGMQQAMAQPKVQRIQGQGNGGLVLDMTQPSIDQAILKSNNYRVDNPIYESGRGPITVEIVDSSKACGHDFIVYLRDTLGAVTSTNPEQIVHTGISTIGGATIMNVTISGGFTTSASPCGIATGPFLFFSGGSTNGKITVSFTSVPASSVQINAVFGAAGAGNLHFKINGIDYTLVDPVNLGGPIGTCVPAAVAVVTAGDLTNAGHTSEYASNTVIIRGPINSMEISSTATDNINLGIFVTPVGNSKWYIKELASGDVDSSDNTIAVGGNSEKILTQWGLKMRMQQVTNPGDGGSVNNGLLESTMTFADTNKKWLTGFPDIDRSTHNWILSGQDSCSSCLPPPPDYYPFEDTGQVYEHVLNGTWSPFRLASYYGNGPLYDLTAHNFAKLNTIASVDIILTSDTSKWSRSVVIEEQSDITKAQGNARKGDPRAHASVDKNGLQSGDPGYNAADGDLVSTTGMGWFPGYAVNLETGERLNIMFGENSYLGGDNGRDMKFNPTSTDTTPYGDVILGGMHYIYIMGHSVPTGTIIDSNYVVTGYDDCKILAYRLATAAANSNSIQKRFTWKDCMWVNLPKLEPGHSLLETDAKIRLRVGKAYRNYDVGGTYSPLDTGNMGIPDYTFSIGCTVGLDEQTDKTKSMLQSVYPNPFSDLIYIKATMQEKQHVTITVYDLLGDEVTTLEDNFLSRGDYTFSWNGKDKEGVTLANGLYLVRMQTEKESIATPVVLLRN